MNIQKKVRKQISRAMEDVRGLDQRYMEAGDSEGLVEALNNILEHTTKEVLLSTGYECWKYSGDVCSSKCSGLCKNSC